MKRVVCTIAMAVCLATSLCQSTSADKPGSNTLPAVTVTPNPAVFVDRYDDLGGVLDTSTNLVWGFDSYSLGVGGTTLDYLATVGANGLYLQFLETAINDFSDSSNPSYDPVKAAALQAAYNVAVQYTTWRLPTVAEARDASSKGLFTYATGGCNVYYGSPAATASGPLNTANLGNWRWTSNTGKPARGGFPSAWVWVPDDGSAQLLPNSLIPVIWVRTVNP